MHIDHLSFRHFARSSRPFYALFSVAFYLFPSIFTPHLNIALHASKKLHIAIFLSVTFRALLALFPPFLRRFLAFFRQFLRRT
jgi:hypothetical protein